MKKYLLVFIALLLTGAVVMASVFNSAKKITTKKEKQQECPYKKTHCSRTASVACY